MMPLLRNKALMSNTISKLEKKIHDLTEQMEEEQKMSTEQRELVMKSTRAPQQRETTLNQTIQRCVLLKLK